jgi:hypothetical protein
VAVTERQTEAAPLEARDESRQGQCRAVLHSGAAIESSGERGSMARKRYQKGFVYLDGDKWKGRYREDVITGEGTKRVRREVILGNRREMTKPLAD